MSISHLVLLGITALVASGVGAITGSTSLLIVPVMLFVGIDTKTAIATNMVAIVCLSAGGTLPFLIKKRVPLHPTLGLSVSSIPGSLVGAFAALVVSERILQAIIACAMVAIAAVTILHPRFGEAHRPTTPAMRAVGYVGLAAWGVYGGLFSGGYATGMTAALVLFFGVTFLEAVAVTKVVNFTGSIAAVAVFATEGRIDWTLAAVLGTSALVGGWVGGKLALAHGERWVRRVFVVILTVLAAWLVFRLLGS